MDETGRVLRAQIEAREGHEACALATVVETSGSIPREVGARMLVFPDGRTVGTIGGGKFESLVIADAIAAIPTRETGTRSYPLHEDDSRSFGAICGGEVRVLIEPQGGRESLFLVGGGHCSRALAGLARGCGLGVTVIDDRPEILDGFPAHRRIDDLPPEEFIAGREWSGHEAIVLVSRSYALDRDALRAALAHPGAGYIGMIGSRRKVRRVFYELKGEGVATETLSAVHAPIGLDIGADSPAEIAVSILAEVLAVLRGTGGRPLREKPECDSA